MTHLQSDLSIAVAQIEARPNDLSASGASHVRMAKLAASCGAKLLMYPELSLTGYSRELTLQNAIDPSGATLVELLDVAQAKDITIIVGAPLNQAGLLTIGAFTLFPNRSVALYVKRFLHDGEERTFAPGGGGAPLCIHGTRFGLAICADINHSAHVAASVRDGAEVYAASCFLTPSGLEQDCSALCGYAKSYGIPVLMANYSGMCGGFESAGKSTVWDEQGQIVAQAPPVGECIVLAQRRSAAWKGRVIREGA